MGRDAQWGPVGDGTRVRLRDPNSPSQDQARLQVVQSSLLDICIGETRGAGGDWGQGPVLSTLRCKYDPLGTGPRTGCPTSREEL